MITQAVPEKELLGANRRRGGHAGSFRAHCPWMAMNGLESDCRRVRNRRAAHEIHVDAALREGALVPLNRMLDFAATLRT